MKTTILNHQLTAQNSKIQTAPRSSNFELLRIIAMLFIILHHCTIAVLDITIGSLYPVNKFLLETFRLCGGVGNTVFIAISAYFIINNTFSLKKLFKLILEILFFSITFFTIFKAFNIVDISLSEAIYSFIPITNKSTWFVSAYVIFYILSPFLNKFAKSLTQKSHFTFACILLIWYCILPTITVSTPGITVYSTFFLIYFIISYIKLYEGNIFNKKPIVYLLGATFSYSLYLFSLIALNMCKSILHIFEGDPMLFSEYYQIPTVFCGIFLFLFFKNLNMKPNKIINFIASSMLGVYLIHQNYFLRKILFVKFFNFTSLLDTPFFIPSILLSIFIVLIGCVVLDKLRIFLIEKPLFKILDKYSMFFIKTKKNCGNTFNSFYNFFN